MTSGSLQRWQQDRSRSLDNLQAGHSALTRRTQGRQWFTEEMNHALIMRLAGEFQGFCRDLYLESADFVSACVSDPGLANVMQLQFGTAMQLSKANATRASIANDFKRFGFSFWTEVDAIYPVRGPAWKVTLDDLNDARNAIAHQDDAKLTAVRAKQPLTLATARRWRSSLGTLAKGMDNVVGSQVKVLIGAAPW